MLYAPVIGGFTQGEGTWNGAQELRERLLAEFDAYSALSVRFPFYPWNSDWRDVARRTYLLRERYRADRLTMLVFAFSWGVGNGLVKYAKRLQRYGIEIDCAVICDGVYRHWFTPGNWRIVIGDTRIHLPSNVKSYYGFYQETERPCGKKPVSDSAVCLGWEKLNLPHVEMDDSYKWHDKCVELAHQYAPAKTKGPLSVPQSAPQSFATSSRISQ